MRMVKLSGFSSLPPDSGAPKGGVPEIDSSVGRFVEHLAGMTRDSYFAYRALIFVAKKLSWKRPALRV
ncbi:hypothetical protein ACFX2J_023187 [Malus domestica]